MEAYRTIYQEADATIEVKKSKFIGHAKPVNSEEEAQVFIKDIKKAYRDASHNVFAYTIGERDEIQKCSDDGEPSGSAGVPMLEVLKKEKLHNLVVVVTRYYGGVKLGVGGLIRAYTEAQKEAIREAKEVSRQVFCRLALQIPYELNDKIMYFIEKEGIILLDKAYLEQVNCTLLLEEEKTEEVMKQISEISNGQMPMHMAGKDFYTVYEGEVLR